MSSYASPVLVISKKSQHPSAELSDTRRLVINYRALNQLAATVQTAGKIKGCIGLGTHTQHRPNLG